MGWQEETVDVGRVDEHEEGAADVENNVQLSSLQRNLELKPAEAVANLILEWMMDYGVDQTLTHLAGDSTDSNTGWKKGVIAWLERKIGRKMHWLVCGKNPFGSELLIYVPMAVQKELASDTSVNFP